jgi:YYY domain-containing protein
MTINSQNDNKNKSRQNTLIDIGIVVVFLLAAYFRITGLFWGEYSYMHPDERFLIWVGTDISPMVCETPDIDANACPEDQVRWMGFSEYFDTVRSTLNPNNRGHEWYVYGTLPMYLTRYTVQWIYGHSGFEEMTNVGRSLSTVADLLTVLMVLLIGSRIYDRRVGLLGAAFLAATVLHIQQSHFFTMDTFITFFTLLAFYFAMLVSFDRRAWPSLRKFFMHPLFIPSLLFGIALGMAVASKINAFLMAAMLPAAMLINLARQPKEDRLRKGLEALVYLALAAIASLIIFRIFQPHAFLGPGFFDLKINPDWIADLKSLYAQARNVDVDFPPQLQWARRSILFSGENMVIWGMGLPLGILSFAGFIWIGWRILTSLGKTDEWQQHALIMIWTTAYFGYQLLAPNPTMRYQMPVYPTLVIMAAWVVIAIWDRSKTTVLISPKKANRQKIIAAVIGIVVLVATLGWAFAFSQMYTKPFTRVEASRWIYENVPGAVNLRITAEDGAHNQPIPLPGRYQLKSTTEYSNQFRPRLSGILEEIYLPHVSDENQNDTPSTLEVLISSGAGGEVIAKGSLTSDFSPTDDPRGNAFTIQLDQPVRLEDTQTYNLILSMPNAGGVTTAEGILSLGIFTSFNEMVEQTLATPVELNTGTPYDAHFIADATGMLSQVIIDGLEELSLSQIPGLNLTILSYGESGEFYNSPLIPQGELTDGKQIFNLVDTIPLFQSLEYQIHINAAQGGASLSLSGDTIANEGEWDDGLPLRLDGYDPYGGIYPQDMNFNMYWDDNPEKLERFMRILEASDTIAISSNRQYGTLTRLPERFPLSTLYYRRLLGCPEDKDILWCYRVAEPGMFKGDLGFDLVKVFQSDPSLGPLSINDQFAEEAFTVYDHPKVLVFQKNAEFDPEKIREILGSVELNNIIKIPPLRYETYPADLTLPVDRLESMRENGTWSELFNTNSWINRYQPLAVVAWYLMVFFLGLLAYPIIRAAFPGLSDRGYPLARILGLLLLAYVVWLAGSFKIEFNRLTITLAFLLLAIVGVLLGIRQRKELQEEWRTKKRFFFSIEALFLAFFLLDLLIRIGNPDVWHPYKGGEKPMDFAYFNAILKSSSFPPYDPWYSGGYLNYYYFGFVLFGILSKWLGITPAISYNLILPTIFAMIALGAFSISWNLYGAASKKNRKYQALSGLAGALGMALLGNLGILRMIWQGFQKLAAPGGLIDAASIFERLTWGLQGFLKTLTGSTLPYGYGDWYWLPSRAIPAMGDIEPITEFPFFTVLYADLHAHLFALPLTLLALAFVVSILLSKCRWRSLFDGVLGFFIGALALGSLRPTNTWDLPTFLVLALAVLGYSLGSYYHPSDRLLDTIPILKKFSRTLQKALVAAVAMIVLVGLTFTLFKPFADWYALGYSKIAVWGGPRTPFSSYLIHWGLFMFLIVSWLMWEARDWMAHTPISALNKLRPFAAIIASLAGILFILIMLLGIKVSGLENLPFGRGIQISWVVLPLAAMAGILLLNPRLPDARKFILFLVGSGFILTLMVEIVVLVGDIGRMNTVFKIYLQVWTFFSISAAVGLGWLFETLPGWSPGLRRTWQTILIILVAGAALYPLLAGIAKVKDRMVESAPHTLDGMAYMNYASYDWKGPMDLSQDYRAIRWMQENVEGSPVIVEANMRDLYRWGSRFSINTGLPAVVGWEWHQQQQRAINPGIWVSNRIDQTDDFYKTINIETARKFLKRYGVKYFVVGQLEKNIYPHLSLEKFENGNGLYWNEVFRDGDTVIYQVIQN